MHKGLAKKRVEPYAGRVPLIIQSVVLQRRRVIESLTRPEEVLPVGRRSIARGHWSSRTKRRTILKLLADMVEEADRIGLPVIAHVYPRDFSKGAAIDSIPRTSCGRVRCGIECGLMSLGALYGRRGIVSQIISTCPVPW